MSDDKPKRPPESPEHRERRGETPDNEPALTPVGPQGGAAISPTRQPANDRE